AGRVDVARHDADLALARLGDPRAVGAYQAGALALEEALDPHHVHDRDALGDGHDQLHAGVGGLHDGVGREGRRHEHDGGVGARGRDGVGHGVEARDLDVVGVRASWHAGVVGLAAEADGLAALAGADGGHHVRAVGDGLVGVEGAGLAQALDEETRVLAYQRAHAAPPASSTILRAPSFMSLALTTLRPDSSMIRLPSSALVPSSRTTSGTFRPTLRTAATTPLAMVSPFMMPPKMFTKMP